MSRRKAAPPPASSDARANEEPSFQSAVVPGNVAQADRTVDAPAPVRAAVKAGLVKVRIVHGSYGPLDEKRTFAGKGDVVEVEAAAAARLMRAGTAELVQ